MPAGTTVFVWGMALVVSAGVKLHYSAAGARELAWVLTPTAWLVEAVSGMSFVPAGAAGYFNTANGVLIAPACAGVNFMVMSLCMAALAGAGRFSSSRGKFAWFLASAAGSYCLGIVVNTVRIVAAIHLYRADIYGGMLTPERLHRLEGVIFYLAALTGVFLLIERLPLPRSGGKPEGRPGPVRPHGDVVRNVVVIATAPLGAYLLFAILIPYLNGAAGRERDFGEHCLTVAAGCAIVLLGLLLIELRSRQPRNHSTTHETKNPDR